MNKKETKNFEREEQGSMSGTTATDKNDVSEHRVCSFETLGFSKEDSKKLANARYISYVGDKGYDFPLSWHKVKKALDSGCSHELALKIFT